ncbi:2-amino-4-hydroxy-6-hydroxymethyldihydropteridine diphosphokinase [Terrarubrum flagellatum]|uniref:2-amino-4-hydroxy-6- hydroxymethyldihydropteridine diphosphokinase n=1 Tax=Terrirubrum flagellatum TaxID=2895980 RepID=UPI0031453C62
MARVALGFGGNIGDARATIALAMTRLEQKGVRTIARSGDYETKPWGPIAQAPFVNACALVETALDPRALLVLCKRIESELGRISGERWGPRAIDIDILTYDDLALDEPDLTIPHKHMLERAFVVIPLLEIMPDAIIDGRRLSDVAATFDLSDARRLD